MTYNFCQEDVRQFKYSYDFIRRHSILFIRLFVIFLHVYETDVGTVSTNICRVNFSNLRGLSVSNNFQYEREYLFLIRVQHEQNKQNFCWGCVVGSFNKCMQYTLERQNSFEMPTLKWWFFYSSEKSTGKLWNKILNLDNRKMASLQNLFFSDAHIEDYYQ